jgi:signal transduction histidine kinase/CheY-like chemotaxis protein
MDNINALPAVIFQYHFTEDDRFYIDDINTAVISFLGISPKDCCTQPHLFLGALTADSEQAIDILKKTCQLCCNLQLEISQSGKNFLLNTSPIENEKYSGCGVIVDVTQQALAREKEVKKVRFLSFVQDQLDDLFYYKDRNSRFLGGNLAWSRYHGAVNPAELIGKSDADSKILSPEAKRTLFQEEQDMMASGGSIRFRESHIINNQQKHFESLKTSLFENNKVIGLVGLTRDITAQVTAEIELKKSQAEAEHLAQVKSSFLAVMSHEIRTPMNGVIGCASLLNETRLDDEQRQLLATIRSSGESLLVIINDILDYSKIEAGKMEFDRSSFDLRTLIEECLELFSKQVNEKGLEINYLLTPDLPATLIGDSSRIRQIINNLLGNAIKFTEKGEVFVEVSLLEIHSNDKTCELLIAIKDTGIGIAKESQTQLFNAFSQADGSITRRYGGTGLGLAISKRIAEQMGGKLWFESELHSGSTFYFSLRLHYDEQALTTGNAEFVEDFNQLRALIVDDNATNRRVLSSTLIQWGMQVAAFDSAQNTLENLQLGQCYDLMILDFCMPNINGGELAKKIRQFPGMKDKPIIVLSSAQVSKDEWPDVDSTLLKPVRTNTLKRTLMHLLGRDNTQHPTQSHPTKTDSVTRILVVEDNNVNQMVVTMMLKKLGYTNVDCVADGQEAVDALQQRDVDIVLMDIQMDRMDGYTATKIIRSQKGFRDRPWIIALTAGVQLEDSEKAFRIGMNDFITKPVQLKQLQDALNRAEITRTQTKGITK